MILCQYSKYYIYNMNERLLRDIQTGEEVGGSECFKRLVKFSNFLGPLAK